MAGFFEEVKRRKVYRVAVAYVVAAGGIIQLASAAFPAWELPNWALRLVIVLLLIGFPIALIFAWIFDITPSGIERTSATQPQTLPKPQRRRNMLILATVGLVVAAAAGFFLLPRASAKKIDKSIAVLPFDRFSEEEDSAFFADGIQDDILTNLSKIGDLKVISRTSVAGYRGKPASGRDIGKTLGVSYLLEGSVRKSGNRARVNVQLIKAGNDEHLWAEDYDRDLTDVFAIQTDLAQEIANELQTKLSPIEKAQMTRKPTENGEAYLAFVQARDLQWHLEDVTKLRQAEQLYERALHLDGNFALAMAGYSQLESWLYHSVDPWPERREKARTLASSALQSQPDLPEAHLAHGFSHYYGDGNYDAALSEFQIAERGLPNNAEVYLALGAILRREGKWTESNMYMEKCASLSPKDSWPLQNLAFNYQMLHDWPKGIATIEQALQIEPDSISLRGLRAKFIAAATGDLTEAQKVIDWMRQMPEGTQKWYYLCEQEGFVLLLQRRYADALRASEEIDDTKLADKRDVLPAKYSVIGFAWRALGDEAGARGAFPRMKEIAQAALAKKPDWVDARITFATALALLGERDAALAETQRCLDELPLSKDPFHGPDILDSAAQIYAQLNERDRAFAALDHLARVPNPASPETLRLNVVYDPIRNDPRFEPTRQNSVRNFSAVFLALVFGLTSARGEWSVVSTTSEFSSGRAVEHRHLVTEDSATGGRATVDAAMFFAKDARLRVIDNASGNDSLGQIMEREKCIAGVNGGYFDPEFKPLGLRVRDGLTTSTLLRAPLLTGIIFSTRERVDIVRPSSFRSSQKIDAALQCGPFLVEGGAALRTLNNTRSARRTFAAVARDGRVAVGVSSDVTLAELGAMLSAALPAARALNLDGGSSSAFYFHRADGSAVSIAEEKSVRDFIGVSTR